MKNLCGFLLAWLCVSVAHGGRLSVVADQTEVTLGQSFTVTVQAENVSANLKQLRVDALKKDFAIAGVDIQAQATSQVMRLRLYPLKVGPVTIPPLYFAGLSSKALNILIHESNANISRVVIKTGFSSKSLIERQASYFYIDVYSDGSLQWRPPEVPTTPDAHIKALPPIQGIANQNGYVVQRYPYSIMPLKSGVIDIAWPLLEANKFGELLRYAVPRTVIEVAAVPRYLPLHLPVGKVTIAAQPLPTRVKINQPFNWILIIEGAGLSEASLIKLLDFSESVSLKTYPPLVEIQTSGKAWLQTTKFTVPVVPLKSGSVTLPKIVLPYYDPVLERVEAAVVPESTVEVFNPVRQWAWWVMVALAICLAIGFMFWKAVRASRIRLSRRSWLEQLSKSADVRTLRHTLTGSNAGTLGQWLAKQESQFGEDSSLRAHVVSLEKMSFSSTASEDFSQFKRTLLHTLRHRQKNKVSIKSMPLNLFDLVKPQRSG